jgi:hypothetical protein
MYRDYLKRESELSAFTRESLDIESIFRSPTLAEVQGLRDFLAGSMTLESVMAIQAIYAPGKPLRDVSGMNVRVDNHRAPRGCPDMRNWLSDIITDTRDAYHGHVAFETLHPFMDGNGRTGRAMWAWWMINAEQDPFMLGFLHNFYYQTLAASDGRK